MEQSEKRHEVMPTEEREQICQELSGMEYVLLLKAGGRLEDEFLRLASAVCRDTEPDVVYCDEDIEIGGRRSNPFFKPDFAPDTLGNFFYFGGAVLVKRSLLGADNVGVENAETENAEADDAEAETAEVEDTEEKGTLLSTLSDKDCCRIRDAVLTLNASDNAKIVHIPQVLYHACSDWDYSYIDETSMDLAGSEGLVSAVILSKDNTTMLLEALDSLAGGILMPMEYIVVDNGSSEKNRSFLELELEKRGVRYIYHPQEFVYSALCNIGAKAASGRYLLFLNDDIILPDEMKGFPSRMCALAAREKVGAVGARLLYPTQKTGDIPRIQHVGISQLESGPSHKLCTYPDNVRYEKGRSRGVWNCMAVTGACLMVEKSKFEEVGGFDERLFIAYTDVDLCMDLSQKGYLSVVDNNTWLYHYESVSRGLDGREETRAQRLKFERNIFYEKHPEIKEGDRFYNRNLTTFSLDYSADCKMPWEEHTMCPEVGVDGCGHLQQKLLPEGKIMGSIDHMSYEAATFDGDVSCIVLEGWSLLHGRDHLDCEPAVVLIARSGAKKTFSAVRKYRGDLGGVFTKEKNILMSGFVCRIPIADLEEGTTRLGVGVIRSGLFREGLVYYMMTDRTIEN